MSWTSAEFFAKQRSKRIYSAKKPKNYLFFVMAALMTAGVAVGTVLASSGYLSESACKVILQAADETLQQQRSAKMFTTAAAAFLPALAVMALIFLSGFCGVTAPAAMLMPFAKGVGFGVLCGCIYLRDGADAFWQVAVCIFPTAFLAGMLTASAAALSVKLSAKYFKGLFLRREEFPSKTEINQYCIKSLALLAALSVASLAGAAIAEMYFK